MSNFGEPVPYDATAERPTWESLPAQVRHLIVDELGGTPAEIRTAGGGFTGGFAARVRSDSGAELFVKATGEHLPFVHRAYVQESRINPALPEGIPVPGLEFAETIEDWIVLGFEAVDGKAAGLPITANSCDLMLDAWAETAEKLSPTPASLIEAGVEERPIGEELQQFKALAAGRADPFPLPDSLLGHIDDLAALDSGIDEAVKADQAMHFDLRPDNMIIGASRAWICDWNWVDIHAAWLDTACFLTVLHGDGHDADRLFWDHPTAEGVEDEQLDTALAAIAGYYLSMAPRPRIEGVSPYIRKHQRWNGLAAADWLSKRRGW